MPRVYTPLSEETKRKISQSEKGKVVPADVRKKMSLAHIGMTSPNKGKRLSDEWRANMSATHKRNGTGKWLKGRRLSIDARRQRSLSARRGSEHHNWQGGITSTNETIRKSVDYKLWREAVFARDAFTCLWCGQVGGELNADHIKRFADYPALRFDVANGRTLCVPCHKTTDTYGFKPQPV